MKRYIRNMVVRILTWEAARALDACKPKVVAITGSVGKTSTKDAIAAALETEHRVRKSAKSFNSEIGLPLTILGLENPWSNPLKWILALVRGFFVQFNQSYPAWLVLEVGADHPGDIRSLSTWLKTDVAVFTRFADTPVHIEFFDSREAVLEEKLSLIQTLRDEGAIVMNADDKSFSEGVKNANRTARVTTFGLMPPSDIVSPSSEVVYREGKLVGVEFDISDGDQTYSVRAEGVLGEQHVYPALAAMSVAKVVGVDPKAAASALTQAPRAPGRMRLLPGVKNTTLIDDTYNSSPAAASEAIRTLKALGTGGKKIAVLGDMLELGEHTEREHRELGRVAATSVDLLIAVGKYARLIAEGALNAGMSEKNIVQYADSSEAGRAIQERAEEGDIILFKGSQGTRMERAVLELLKEPSRASELLVRQEKEWAKR